MGPTLASRKRANTGEILHAAGPIPGLTIQRRLINSAGFDKAALPCVAKELPHIQNRKKPGQTAGLLIQKAASTSAQISHKHAVDHTIYWRAAAGVNFATMPSNGLKVCLARSV